MIGGLGVLLSCIALANITAVIAVLLATREAPIRLWHQLLSSRGPERRRKQSNVK